MQSKQSPSHFFRDVKRNSFTKTLLLYIVFVFTIISTYHQQIAEQNAYAGMNPWSMTILGWGVLAFGLFSIVIATSRLKTLPSDFFVLFYTTIPLISLLALYSVSGEIDDIILLPSVAIVVFPLLCFYLINWFIPKIKISGMFPSVLMENGLIIAIIIIIVYLFNNAPPSSGFDIDTVYDRRLEGRDIYVSRSIIAYVMAMCMNGLAPFLAFRGAIRGRSLLLLVAYSTVIFFYWLIGVKAPLLYVVVGHMVGFLAGNGRLKYFPQYFLSFVIALYFVVVVEWWIFDGYSIIADFGFRRLFSVQAEIQGFYLDSIFNKKPMNWNWMIGVADPRFEVTFFVGLQYLGNLATNANTNAFLYAFLANGLFGYLLAIFCVSFFLVLLDRLYCSTHNPTYLLIGFVYGLLLIEQSFSTAMISSGVGLLFLVSLFEKYRLSSNKVIL